MKFSLSCVTFFTSSLVANGASHRGGPCITHGDCYSQNCVANKCHYPRWKLRGYPHPIGSSCTNNRGCVSRHCYQQKCIRPRWWYIRQGLPLPGAEVTAQDDSAICATSFTESKRYSGIRGTDIAVNHDGTVVVAGGGEYGVGDYSNEGQIGIFTRTSKDVDTWTEQIIYGSLYEMLGHSVDVSDISPGYVTAGVHLNQTVRTYRYNQQTFEMEWAAEITDYPNTSFFGWSVAMSNMGTGLRLVASALNHYEGTSFVRIFKYLTNISGDTWEQIGADISGNVGEHFGHEVAMSGDGEHIAIGAPNGAAYYGRIYYYSVSDSGWDPNFKTITGGSPELLGASLSLNADGSVLAAGGRFNSESVSKGGVVRFYDMREKVPAATGAIYGNTQSGFFGVSVSLSANGKRVLVGEQGHQGAAGKASIYDYDDETSQWNPNETVSFFGDTGGDKLGEAVSLSGDGAVAAMRMTHDEDEFLVFDGVCEAG